MSSPSPGEPPGRELAPANCPEAVAALTKIFLAEIEQLLCWRSRLLRPAGVQVPRKMWEADGSRIGRPTDGWVARVRQVAESEQATLLDLHEAVAASYDALGREAVEPFFADARTHTSVAGADHTAQIVIGLLEDLPDSEWKNMVSTAGMR